MFSKWRNRKSKKQKLKTLTELVEKQQKIINKLNKKITNYHIIQKVQKQQINDLKLLFNDLQSQINTINS